VLASADQASLVWAAAEKWKARLPANLTLETAPSTNAMPPRDDTDVAIVPVQLFAQSVPAASVLDLPFLFSGVTATHRALDSGLGQLLQQESARAGWHILGFWDKGMQSLSGNQPYNRLENLAGIEFAQLAPDTIEEKMLRAFDAWPRSVRPASLAQMSQECLVRSRAATLQELWQENLYRVHLNLTLTRHRYEGWIVAMPVERWNRLPHAERKRLQRDLTQTTSWEREESQRREADALKQLKNAGMEITSLSTAEREALGARLAPIENLLPDTLDASLKRRLIALATGTRAGKVLGANKKPLLDAQPNAPGSEPGN
jgi:TRAP-type C4-dicarboxylate transport system substrate-binding protein